MVPFDFTIGLGVIRCSTKTCKTKPSNLDNSANKSDSNWRPWSVVMQSGTPNRENQVEINVSATTSAVIELMGVASIQFVDRSMKERIYLFGQFDTAGRGPTMSKCKCWKRAGSPAVDAGGVIVCRVTLLFWQCKHSLHQSFTSEAKCGQVKRAEISLLVAFQFGCDILWKLRNNFLRNSGGTIGRGMRVLSESNFMSGGIVTTLVPWLYTWHISSLNSCVCASAIACKSKGSQDTADTSFGCCTQLSSSSGRDRQSTTTLLSPAMWTMSSINSDKYENCRDCRGEWSVVFRKDATMDLWLVKTTQ